MGGLTKTWRLLKQSFRVIQHDRELIWHMVFGYGSAVLIMAVVIVPMAVTGFYESNVTAAAIITIIAAYFANLIFTFFYVALIAGVLHRLKGGDPNIRSSLAEARQNILNIVIWATITFIVGLILESLRNNNRTRWVMLIVIAIIGAAWELMTFLVEPVFIKEKVGVFTSMKRSLSILRSTWGAQVGLRSVTGIFYLLTLLVAAGIGVGIGFINIPAGITVGVLIWMPLALFIKTLGGVVKAVVYNYAINKTLPPEMDREGIEFLNKPSAETQSAG